MSAVVTLKKGEGRTIKAGGAWIFDNEIASILGAYENGDIVLVRDFDGYPMGRGFINEHSKIRIRMMTRNIDQEIDEAFLRKRVQDAWEYRKKVTDTSSCRLIFGEADFLPGLVVDKFSDVLVVQSLALGIDKMKMTIIRLLEEVLAADGVKIRGVFERSDAKVREQEGMERVKGFLSEPFDTSVEIVENGVHYLVDVKDGQKTGFFLDQKYNRLAVQKLCKDARVLDCFTHTGSFALNAAYAGAKEVIVSEPNEMRREVALELGADKVVDPTTEDLPQIISEATNGMGADVIVMAIGVPALVNSTLKLCKKGGTVNLFAGFAGTGECTIEVNTIHYNEIKVNGSTAYKREDYLEAADMVKTKKINLDRIATHTYSIEKFQNAYEMCKSGKGLKIIIEP